MQNSRDSYSHDRWLNVLSPWWICKMQQSQNKYAEWTYQVFLRFWAKKTLPASVQNFHNKNKSMRIDALFCEYKFKCFLLVILRTKTCRNVFCGMKYTRKYMLRTFMSFIDTGISKNCILRPTIFIKNWSPILWLPFSSYHSTEVAIPERFLLP